MVDRIGEKRWIALGFTAQACGLAVIAVVPSLTGIVFSYLFYAFFGLMEMPAIQFLLAKLVPTSGRGLAFSLSFIPSTLMGAVAPVLTAFIVDGWGIWTIFPFAIGLLIIAITLLGLLWQRQG